MPCHMAGNVTIRVLFLFGLPRGLRSGQASEACCTQHNSTPSHSVRRSSVALGSSSAFAPVAVLGSGVGIFLFCSLLFYFPSALTGRECECVREAPPTQTETRRR